MVSTSTSYQLTVTSNRTLVANFVAFPTVSLSAAPRKGGIATFTVNGRTTNPSRPIVVSYSLSGNAALGYSFGSPVKLVRLTPEPKPLSFGIATRKGRLSLAAEKFWQCAIQTVSLSQVAKIKA